MKEDIVCTSYISALYLHNMNFQGKIYVVGNPSMGTELDRFDLKHTGIGVSMKIRLSLFMLGFAKDRT